MHKTPNHESTQSSIGLQQGRSIPVKRKCSKVFRNYLVSLFSLVVIALSLLAWLNFANDPYAAFARWQQSSKTEQFSSESSRITKANEIAAGKYDLFLLGSSRTELGLNPNVGSLAEFGVGYNAALPGSNLYETNRVASFVLKQHQATRNMFLSLELVMFGNQRTVVDDFERSLFAVDDFEDRLNFEARMLWGASSTEKSCRSMLALNRTDLERRYQNGFRLSTNQTRSAASLSRDLRDYYLQSPDAFNGFQFSEARWRELIEIIQLCEKNNVKMILFFPPLHAEFLEVIHQAKLWDVFERLKRRVANEPTIKQLQQNGTLDIWEFTSYRGVCAEAIPMPTDGNGQMKHYFEISHYRPQLGDAMVQAMCFDKRTLPYELSARQLTSKNVEEVLAEIREERADYLEQRAENLGWQDIQD